MAQRNTGAPDVYNYNSNTYDPYYSGNPSGQYTSGPSQVSADPRFPTQPHDPNFKDPYSSRIRPSSGNYNSYGPGPSGSSNTFVGQQDYNANRYNEYRRNPYEYKYNIYSLIDEPWNRCCEVGRCGTCPGNEFIARRTPKLDWL